MKKILPIIENPYMRSYAHYAYPFSIITKPLVLQDNHVASVRVKNFNNTIWKNYSEELSYKANNSNQLDFYSNKWNRNMNTVFIRPCNQNDSIEIEINKQLYTHPYANIKIFISLLSDSDFKNAANKTNLNNLDYGPTIGNYSKDGIYYSVEYLHHEILKSNPVLPIKLKLIKDFKRVYIEYSSDNTSLEKKLLIELDKSFIDNKPKIGFSISLGNNSYYEWLFSNFINMSYNVNGQVRLDYITDPIKNWKPYSYNYYIDSNSYYEDELKLLGINTLDYIKQQININRYIELENNNNIHFNKDDSNGQYFHSDLIYGYDDEKQLLYIRYFDFGYLKQCTMTYSNFLSERNQKIAKIVFSHRFNPAYEAIPLTKQNIYQYFIEYLNGTHFTQINMRYPEDQVFIGLNCIKRLCEESSFEILVRDIRICFVLLERAKCNKDRIDFFFKLKWFSLEKYTKLNQVITNELREIEILQSILLRMKIKKTIVNETIANHINHIYDFEKDFTELLLESLTN